VTSYNEVRLTGKIAFDPEIRDIKGGRQVGVFRLEAISSRGKTYVEVTCWDTKLIDLLKTLQRGDGVKIAGELRSNSWETSAGEKRSKVYVVANALVDLSNYQETIDKNI
jgi:single-stranded DNA-binding protein